MQNRLKEFEIEQLKETSMWFTACGLMYLLHPKKVSREDASKTCSSLEMEMLSFDTKGEVTPPPPSPEDTCEANVISPVRELFTKNYQLKDPAFYGLQIKECDGEFYILSDEQFTQKLAREFCATINA
ncbi:hypothetical protein B566_EDAN007664, partial [Ephemera danica]